jgi:hypothetical protein
LSKLACYSLDDLVLHDSAGKKGNQNLLMH